MSAMLCVAGVSCRQAAPAGVGSKAGVAVWAARTAASLVVSLAGPVVKWL